MQNADTQKQATGAMPHLPVTQGSSQEEGTAIIISCSGGKVLGLQKQQRGMGRPQERSEPDQTEGAGAAHTAAEALW